MLMLDSCMQLLSNRYAYGLACMCHMTALHSDVPTSHTTFQSC